MINKNSIRSLLKKIYLRTRFVDKKPIVQKLIPMNQPELIKADVYGRRISGGVTIDSSAFVSTNCTIQAFQNAKILIGSDVTIQTGAIILAYGNATIKIGPKTRIGPRALIHTTEHIHENIDVPIMEQGTKNYDVMIGGDCWLGQNVTINPGVEVGRSSIIGAGSVVIRSKDKKSFPERAILIGNPAKVHKLREKIFKKSEHV